MKLISTEGCLSCLDDVTPQEAAAHQVRFHVELGGPAPDELVEQIKAGKLAYRRVILDGKTQIGLIAYDPKRVPEQIFLVLGILSYFPSVGKKIQEAIEISARQLGCTSIMGVCHRRGLVETFLKAGYSTKGVLIEKILS